MTLEFNAERHEYRVHGRIIPSVTQVLKPLNDLSHIPAHILNAKAELGTEVHKACELINEHGGVDYGSLTERAAPYVEQYERFLAQSGFEPVLSERRVYSAKYGFAGTLDLWGYLHGKAALIDLKNTVTIAPVCGPQSAAYELALAEQDGLETEERYVLQLKPDDYRLVPMNAADDRRTFLAALHIHFWINRGNHR